MIIGIIEYNCVRQKFVIVNKCVCFSTLSTFILFELKWFFQWLYLKTNNKKLVHIFYKPYPVWKNIEKIIRFLVHYYNYYDCYCYSYNFFEKKNEKNENDVFEVIECKKNFDWIQEGAKLV